MGSASDSSDDDDHLKRLIEATDKQFMNDSLFQNKRKVEDELSPEAKETEKSLCWKKLEVDKDDLNFFKVTQGVREYVSRQMDKKLETTIKYVENTKEERTTTKKKKRKRGGVKLFSDSTDFVSDDNTDSIINNNFNKIRRIKLKRRTIDNSEVLSEHEKVKSVAVSPDDILAKRGLEYWSSKNKIFKYKKLKNGTLTSVD